MNDPNPLHALRTFIAEWVDAARRWPEVRIGLLIIAAMFASLILQECRP